MTTSSISPPALLFGLGIEGLSPSPRRSRRPPQPAPHPRHPAPRRCPRSPQPRAPRRPSLPPSVSPCLRLWLCLRRVLLGSRLLLDSGRLGYLGLLLGHALCIHRLGLGGGRGDQLLVDPPAPLGDSGRLADPASQVVELGPPHVATRRDLQFLDLRRVQRERPLHPDPERLLADREGLPGAGALPTQDDSLEDLGAAAAALDYLEVDAHAIAGAEGGKPRPQLATLDAVDDAAHWREKTAGPRRRTPRGGGMVATPGRSRAARPWRDSARPATRGPSRDRRRPAPRVLPSRGKAADACNGDTRERPPKPG